MKNKDISYLSVDEAAKLLNVSIRRVQQLCNEGKINGAVRKNNNWLLPKDSLSILSTRRKKIERKPLPIGISDFKRAVTDYYYIDKTLLIKEFLDTKPQAILFTRPRRFGKTLNMDMIKVFFEKTNEDTSIYFKDKAIWSYGDKYIQEQGKYPVIFLSFKDVKFQTWKDTFDMLQSLIRSEFARHSELSKSNKLSEYDKSRYNEIFSKESGDNIAIFSSSLGTLTELLYKHHQIKPILIIDEYDVPIQQGYSSSFYNDTITFLRNLFSGAIKDNPYLSYAFMTGILKIAKESIFSGMNNLKTDSILDNRFSQYFGFTKEEVKNMFDQYGLSDKYALACQWYDGYQFGEQEMFNPWSIINYVDENGVTPKAYWISTGSNDIIGDLITKANPEVIDNLNKLIRKESVSTLIDLDIIYPEVEKNPNSILSFLLITGYLKVIEKRNINDHLYCKVEIPNKEIAYIYEKEILNKLDKIIPPSSSAVIQLAIFEQDINKFESELQKLLINTISYNDTASESFYQGLTIGLCATMNNYYYVYSNREAGEGRFDICLQPIKDNLPGVIIELKSEKTASGKELEGSAKLALKQIEQNKYDADLKLHGINNILKLGIAYCGKKVKVLNNRH